MKTAADPTARACWARSTTAPTVRPLGHLPDLRRKLHQLLHGPEQPDAHGRRWGLKKDGAGYRWHEFDERLDATRHPNEPNRFGWVVEIDLPDPTMTPIKRTARSRAAHEGAAVR